jgi:hypothetical protein
MEQLLGIIDEFNHEKTINKKIYVDDHSAQWEAEIVKYKFVNSVVSRPCSFLAMCHCFVNLYIGYSF